MRKLMLVVGLVAVLVLVLGAAALAKGAFIQCTNVLPCVATGSHDKVLERQGEGLRDDIRLKGGRDLVLASKYGHDRDKVSGGKGRDKINVADGDKRDTADGGSGRDLCLVDARSEAESCAKVQVVHRHR
jgi:hypothetical protein